MRAPFDIGQIRKAARGDRKASRALIEAHRRLVGHVVYRVCGHSSDFEDLCQDIFLKVFSNLDSFQGQCKLSTWIARIAYNHCITRLRKKKESLFLDSVLENGSLDRLPSDWVQPDMELDTSILDAGIEAAIAALPPNQRAVVTFFYLEQMSYDEIGALMNLPDNTIKSHLFRARKNLKIWMTQEKMVEDCV
jgi:RNA polymerase sigma factor (sigma-70 family)